MLRIVSFIILIEELQPGELACASDYTLMEAMTAIEMDSGMMVTDEKLLGMELVFTYKPDTAERHRMFHSLLETQVSWLNGRSLAQTMFTSYWMHHPERIEDELMKVYVQASWIEIDLISRLVMDAQVHFEEDLVLNYFGLNPETPSAEEVLHHLANILDDKELGETTRSYIQLKKSFLELLEFLTRATGNKEEMKVTIEAFKKNVAAVKKCGVELKEEEKLAGFDFTVVTRIPTTFPVQPVPRLSNVEVFGYLEHLTDNLELICNAMDSATLLLTELVESYMYFASKNPDILARSVNVVFLLRNGKISGIQWPLFIEKSCEAYTRCPYFSSKEPALAMLLQMIEETLVQFVRILNANKGRLRRRLIRWLPTWDLVQSEAEKIDNYFQTGSEFSVDKEAFYIANWIYRVKLLVMEHVLYLGFDLELYAQVDYLGVFWYLDYIYTIQLQNINRALGLRAKRKQSAPLVPSEWAYQAKQDLVRGIVRFLIALQIDGHFDSKQGFDASMTENRFKHRFACFDHLSSPHLLSYESFLSGTNAGKNSSSALYESAYQLFQSTIEQVKRLKNSTTLSKQVAAELESAFKTAFGNSVSLKVIRAKQPSGTQTLKASFQFSPAFPVLSLVAEK